MNAPTPDTADLRDGEPIHDALLALLPLVGHWRGEGVGVRPSDSGRFRYGQRASFVHDGRPFLAYESRTWLLDDAGVVLRQAWRESGFWRAGAGADDVEVVLASNTGESLVFAGVAGDQRWDLATTSAVASRTAKPVDGEKRLYAVRDEELIYVTELALPGRPFTLHLQASLTRD